MPDFPPDMPRSLEGLTYDVKTGTLTTGLPTSSVKPSSRRYSRSTYDVIVIGAGFTGLAAARNLSLKGKRVLLLEGRDRIGGRTWTSHANGHNYEMGGTWIHWLQPHVWAEVTRHGLTDKLKVSTAMNGEGEVSYLGDEGKGIVKESPEVTDERLLPLVSKFFDTHGEGPRTLFPEPYQPMNSAHIWSKWDISLEERAGQLEISNSDRKFLLGWMAMNACSSPKKSSFLNMARLLSLSAYDFNVFMENCGKYKFAEGTTSLATAMFEEFKGDSLFLRPVKLISTNDRVSEVVTDTGEAFFAKQVICTIPLHCLPDISFSPALPKAFIEAKHANFGGKVHFHSDKPVEPWFGISDGHHHVCAAFTDSSSKQGGTHLVSFAIGDKLFGKRDLSEDPEAYLKAIQNDCVPSSIDVCPTSLTWHDWAKDRFSKGAWASFGPNQHVGPLSKIMKTKGNVSDRLFMASADWADGWIGYIDGALEMGMKAAKAVGDRLDGAGQAAVGSARL